MAKQSVSFIERHAEKFVLGVAGGCLALVVALFLIRTPNKVEFGGQHLGPQGVDLEVRQRVSQMRRAMERAQPEEVTRADPLSRLQEYFEKPLTTSLGSSEVLVPPVGFGPPVVDLPGGPMEQMQPVRLIAPPAPSTPLVHAGRSLGSRRFEVRELPAPGEKPPDQLARPAELEDVDWVTIAGTVDLAAAGRAYQQAGYSPGRSQLIIADVQMQRQQRRADGSWDEWRELPAARIFRSPAIPQFRLSDEGRLSPQDNATAVDLERLVDARRDLILRPPIPPLAGGNPWAPPPLPGMESQQWFEAIRSTLEKSGPKLNLPGWDNPRRAAPKYLAEVDKAMERGDYETAKRLASEVADNAEITRHKRLAQKKFLEAVKRQEEEEERRAQMAAAEGQQRTELEYFWVHDLSVEPGESYRYRLRLQALNRYVGEVTRLVNIDDATRVAMVSAWSAPSQPVSIEPNVRFYLASGARVDVFRWYLGRWYRTTFRGLEPGEMIGGPVSTRSEDLDGQVVQIDFSTGAMVVDLQEDQTLYQQRRSLVGGGFELLAEETAILTYLDARGTLRQRSRLQDSDDELYKELKDST